MNEKNDGLMLSRGIALVMAIFVAMVSGILDELLMRGEGLLWILSFFVFLGGYVAFLPFYVQFRSAVKLTFKEAFEEGKRVFQSNVRIDKDEDGKTVIPQELKVLGISMILYYFIATFVGDFVVNSIELYMVGS